MKGSSLNIEKIIYDSAEDIEIDRQFKSDLKKRIMASAALKDKPTFEINNHRSKMPYLKVASWVLFAALSGSAIWGGGSFYSHMEALNNQTKTVAEVPGKDASKNNIPAAKDNSTVDTVKQVASADTQSNLNKAQSSPVVTPSQPSKSNTKTSVNKPSVKTQSGTLSAGNTGAGTGTTAPSKTTDTLANTGTTVPPATDPVNTITLNMEAGRYIIKDINVTKSETVPTLPEEYKSLTADQCAALPAASSQTVFEKDGEVHMISHVNGKDIFIDKGKTPVLYEAIGLVSYIKDTSASDAEGSKSSSEVWVFDSNSANKYNLLSSEDGKYTYLNTFWSNDGKALYVLEENNNTNKYDLVELTLDIQQ